MYEKKTDTSIPAMVLGKSEDLSPTETTDAHMGRAEAQRQHKLGQIKDRLDSGQLETQSQVMAAVENLVRDVQSDR